MFHDLWSFNHYSVENQVSSNTSSSWSILFGHIQCKLISWGCSPCGFKLWNRKQFSELHSPKGSNAFFLEKDNWPNTHYHLNGCNSLGLLLSNFFCFVTVSETLLFSASSYSSKLCSFQCAFYMKSGNIYLPSTQILNIDRHA